MRTHKMSLHLEETRSHTLEMVQIFILSFFCRFFLVIFFVISVLSVIFFVIFLSFFFVISVSSVIFLSFFEEFFNRFHYF